MKGFAGLAGATGLMLLGVSEKLARFFKGPSPDPEAETALLQKKLQRLQQTAEERAVGDAVERRVVELDHRARARVAAPDGWPLRRRRSPRRR